MKAMNWTLLAVVLALLGSSGGRAATESSGSTVPSASSADTGRSLASSTLTKQLFSVSVNGATAENVVRMIATKVGIPVQIEGDLSKRVTYSFANTTLENALQQMANDVGFDYSVRDEVLYVTKRSANRATASQNAHLIELKYADADDMGAKLKGYVGQGADIHVDKKMNSIVLVGSDSAFDRAQKFVSLFDRMPQQILIEAKIVEANDNFSREIGMMVGDLTGTDFNNNNYNKATGYSNPGLSSASPQLGLRYKLGITTNRNLDVRLLAAESKGDAKVVSRPKVVTINNTRALINSGVTLNVKTLSTVTTAGSGGTATTPGVTTPSGSVAGGLEQLSAGLQLGVLPSVLNNNFVRLVVDVNNSQPDSQYTVDGVPGISTNAANTSVIVENGATAVLAGLIRNSDSKARSGVPFLSDIPILGLLFRTDGSNRRNDEMMIFITPRILSGMDGVKQAQLESEAELPKELPIGKVKEDAKKEAEKDEK